MSLSRNTSIRTARFSLPSYTAATRLPQPPTYEQHLETLPAPERAFIADQARILNNIHNPLDHPKPVSTSTDPEIERLQIQRLLNAADPPTQPPIPARRTNRAEGWSIFLSVVLLFTLPLVYSFLKNFADQLSPSTSTKCLGRHRPTAKGTCIFFGVALAWLSAWVLMRVWRFRIRVRNGRVGYKWSVFWSLLWGLGFCVLVAVIWARKVCV